LIQEKESEVFAWLGNRFQEVTMLECEMRDKRRLTSEGRQTYRRQLFTENKGLVMDLKKNPQEFPGRKKLDGRWQALEG